jgi:glucosamine kinase
VLVVHDTRLVLAAAGLDVGIALIAGTGSVAYARNAEGRDVRVGGWGWMLGDEGSGTWIVRLAVRELLRRQEAGEPLGVLGERMLAATETGDVIEMSGRLQGYHEPGQWAAFAGLVFEATADPAAVQIIDSAAQSLAQLAGRAGAKVGVKGPVVMAGGLVTNQPDLVTRVQARISPATVLEEEPVAGAVRLAQQL